MALPEVAVVVEGEGKAVTARKERAYSARAKVSFSLDVFLVPGLPAALVARCLPARKCEPGISSNSSLKMQPTDQMSIGDEYGSMRMISGARYLLGMDWLRR